ncbi:MAG: hypothetical protein IJ880_11700 [Bacilli bacterium]|nr:hypothetical protein [Bacilli bacterium]
MFVEIRTKNFIDLINLNDINCIRVDKQTKDLVFIDNTIDRPRRYGFDDIKKVELAYNEIWHGIFMKKEIVTIELGDK